jgi:hypothetical protein
VKILKKVKLLYCVKKKKGGKKKSYFIEETNDNITKSFVVKSFVIYFLRE